MLMVLSDSLLKVGNLFYGKIQLGNMVLFLDNICICNTYMYIMYITWNDTDLIHYRSPLNK